MKKFYQLTQNDNVAELYIYGDITSFKWFEEDVTAKSIIDEINSISADVINVYISSYGGEVQAGLAIYNALKRHKAKVRTICDGFACSIASVIFMAGEERIMNDSSLLMIHNAWSFAEGNAKELKKIAEDNNYTEFALQATDINLGKLSGSGEGKEAIVSVDTSLLLTRENNDGSYTVKDAELKNPVQVKMKLPNNYQVESMELWNVTDDNSVNYIKDVTFVWEGSELYIVFETKVFGQFIVYAKDITTSADIFVGGTKFNENIGEIALDAYYNKAQTVSLYIKDEGLGVASVQYYVSSSIYDYEGIKKIDGWKDYKGQFTLETNKNHVIYVKLTDTLGNISYFASKGIIIDDIAPSITGITNRNYCTSPTMTVKETNLKTVTMDGKNIILKIERIAPYFHNSRCIQLCIAQRGNEQNEREYYCLKDSHLSTRFVL